MVGSERRVQAVAVAGALGLTVGGLAFGVLAALCLGFLAFELAAPHRPDGLVVVQVRYLQFGFLLFALGYVAVRGTPRRYVKLRRPTRRDAGWIVAIPLALALLGTGFDPVLASVGLLPGGAGADGFPVDVLARPWLWPVVFVAWFLLAAPGEELLFRGVIQGRLGETFDAARAVGLAAVLFALAHVLLGFVTGRADGAIAANAVETFASGLVFGAAYERTDNLVVPAVAHAGLWTLGLALA